jgi:uncharacterized membrane protein YraQ (UPF0718 family)
MLRHLRKIEGKWIFFSFVLFLGLALAISNYQLFLRVFFYFLKILGDVAPALAVVFLMMFFANLLVKPEIIVRHLGEEAGFRKWLVAVFGGIISSGPIYLWYPLLADLKEKGMSNSLMAAFLYSRAVKIPLMPLMAYYFGWAFVVVFSFYLVVSSIIAGWLVGEIAGEEVGS